MSYVIWFLWLDWLYDSLYAFMERLLDVSEDAYLAMNAGFDGEYRRLFPEYFAE